MSAYDWGAGGGVGAGVVALLVIVVRWWRERHPGAHRGHVGRVRLKIFIDADDVDDDPGDPHDRPPPAP